MRHILLVSLVTACGDVSNAPFAEDLEYLDALPSEERHAASIEDASARTGDGAVACTDGPQLRTFTCGTAVGLNRLVYVVLGAVDWMRQQPPSERTEAGRRWGPYPWDAGTGAEVEGWVERSEGGGRFDWGVDVAVDGATLGTVAWGTHYAGETVRDGDGLFQWDHDLAAEVTGADEGGSVAYDYDNREGVDFVADVRDFYTDGDAPASWTAAFRATDTGDFQFRDAWDLDGNGSEENVAVRTRWVPGEGGRADAVLSGGSLGALEVEWTQCWDGAATLTYEHDTMGWNPDTGSEPACPFQGFAQVDRL